MGKCSVCGKKIEYNKFKTYRGKVQCYDCYDKRLDRKAAKKEAAKEKVEEDKQKIINDLKKEHGDDFNPFDEPKEKAEELDAYEDKEE